MLVFDKLTRACFFQIALETMLLPILITQVYNGRYIRLSGNNNKLYLPREKQLKDIGNKKQVPIHIIVNSVKKVEHFT